MTCFTLSGIEHLLIWLVALIVIVAIIRLVLPRALALFGPAPAGGGLLFQVVSYVLWGVVAVFCIVIAFDLIACIAGNPFSLR